MASLCSALQLARVNRRIIIFNDLLLLSMFNVSAFESLIIYPEEFSLLFPSFSSSYLNPGIQFARGYSELDDVLLTIDHVTFSRKGKEVTQIHFDTYEMNSTVKLIDVDVVFDYSALEVDEDILSLLKLRDVYEDAAVSLLQKTSLSKDGYICVHYRGTDFASLGLSITPPLIAAHIIAYANYSASYRFRRILLVSDENSPIAEKELQDALPHHAIQQFRGVMERNIRIHEWSIPLVSTAMSAVLCARANVTMINFASTFASMFSKINPRSSHHLIAHYAHHLSSTFPSCNPASFHLFHCAGLLHESLINITIHHQRTLFLTQKK